MSARVVFSLALLRINKCKKKEGFDKKELKKELNELTEAGLSLPAASRYLAKKNNLTKNFIYNLK